MPFTSTEIPEQTSPAYCTDEDILVRARGDMVMLTPSWQSMAYGVDGVFSSGFPWVLSSATVNFQGNGVQPNQIMRLTKPVAQYKGGAGDLLAIDSVSGSQVTLRRAHQDLNVGNPPAPATGLTGVEFTVLTMQPQIEEASFDLKRRYGVDEAIWNRSSDWMYTKRELRIATVLMVLLDSYTFEARTNQGDFEKKAQRIRQQLNDVINRIQVRWGSFGTSQPPTTIFSGKISR